jgi:hypothetical protein
MEDIREAEMCLAGNNTKAAIVMAGACVEAMMLALLEEETAESRSTLRSKSLRQYIALVREHSLVGDQGMLNVLDHSLREWRNYIHPGKVLRTGVDLTGDHAKIAVASMRAFAAMI